MQYPEAINECMEWREEERRGSGTERAADPGEFLDQREALWSKENRRNERK